MTQHIKSQINTLLLSIKDSFKQLSDLNNNNNNYSIINQNNEITFKNIPESITINNTGLENVFENLSTSDISLKNLIIYIIKEILDLFKIVDPQHLMSLSFYQTQEKPVQKFLISLIFNKEYHPEKDISWEYSNILTPEVINQFILESREEIINLFTYNNTSEELPAILIILTLIKISMIFKIRYLTTLFYLVTKTILAIIPFLPLVLSIATILIVCYTIEIAFIDIVFTTIAESSFSLIILKWLFTICINAFIIWYLKTEINSTFIFEPGFENKTVIELLKIKITNLEPHENLKNLQTDVLNQLELLKRKK